MYPQGLDTNMMNEGNLNELSILLKSEQESILNVKAISIVIDFKLEKPRGVFNFIKAF